jgi:NTE family protein
MSREKSASVRIGLALGSGSSRGWAHIGVIKALAEIGIEPDIICGCSIGALVGAAYAAGNLDHLEQWALSLTRLEIARYFEINLSLNGFVDTGRLHSFLVKHVCNEQETIENLKKTYAAVSTELATGREKWFTSGPVIEAVWASISLPGLFPPMQSKGRWLVDGGLVNPVPVSLCRAMGADIVIAVNLNGDIVRKNISPKPKKSDSDSMIDIFAETVKKYSANIFAGKQQRNAPPDLFNALASSINIMQDKITRSRMAGDPPDILLTPKLSHIGLLEFYRAAEAIQEGRGCVNRMLPEIHYVAGMGSEGNT